MARGEGVHEFKKGPEPFLAGGRRLGGKRIATGDSVRRLGPGFYLASHRHGASSAARVAVGPAALPAARPLCRALRKGHARWRCCGGARLAGPRNSPPPPRGKFSRLALRHQTRRDESRSAGRDYKRLSDRRKQSCTPPNNRRLLQVHVAGVAGTLASFCLKSISGLCG